MPLEHAFLVELIDLLRLHEAYQRATDLQTSARQQEAPVWSPLTQETMRLREELEVRLLDAAE